MEVKAEGICSSFPTFVCLSICKLKQLYLTSDLVLVLEVEANFWLEKHKKYV
jgi:hypothetical protein